jgi:hypothetical protein
MKTAPASQALQRAETADFAVSMREQLAAEPYDSSLSWWDSKSPAARRAGSTPAPGTNNLAAVEHHRSRIRSRKSFRKTWLSAGRTDGPLNTPHTRMKPGKSPSACLIAGGSESPELPGLGTGLHHGYEANDGPRSTSEAGEPAEVHARHRQRQGCSWQACGGCFAKRRGGLRGRATG